MKTRHATLLLLGLCVGAQARAGDITPPADLPPIEAVKTTLEAMPEVTKAEARLKMAHAEHARLRAGPHEYALTLQGQRRDLPGSVSENEWQASLQRGLRLPGKASLDDRIGAEAVREKSELVGDARHEAARRLLSLWYQARRAQAETAMLRAQRVSLERESEIAARRLKAGDAARIDSLQAEAALAQARARLRQSEAATETLLGELKLRYPDLPAPSASNAEPGLPKGDETEWLARTSAHNHEIMAQQRALDVARLNVQRAESERLPDPTLGLHLASEAGGDEHVVGISIAFPLPGQARRAEIEARGAEVEAIAVDEAAVRRRIEVEARANWRNAEAGVRNWRELRLAATAMTRHAELARRAHELGELGLTDTLLAGRAALDAGLAAEHARIGANEAIARLLLDAHELWPLDSDHDH